jgi:23S rRNA (uridine2552-2'-O)-methyltransferase
VVAQQLGGRGRIVALDILPMPSIPGVSVLEGDFREGVVVARLELELDNRPVDLVLSDMAPNMSGVGMVDQARAMELAELALEFARRQLVPGGDFLIKLFQGVGFDAYLRDLRRDFAKVTMRKPKASRARSREVYALASGFRGGSAALA